MQTRQHTRMPLTARPGVAHPVTTHGKDPVHASPYRETVHPGARVRADGGMTPAGSELLALQRLYGNRHVQRLIEQHRNQADGDIRHTSAGRRLPDNMRSTMERAFGTDLHEVRLHEGPAASAVGALAYTQGTDIYFGPGEYQPHTPYGRALIGHELTHVVQQQRRRVAAPLGAGMPINDDARLEGEAHELGLRAAHGRTVNVTGNESGRPLGHGPAPIQRTPKLLKRLLRAVGLMAPPPAGGAAAPPPVPAPAPTQASPGTSSGCRSRWPVPTAGMNKRACTWDRGGSWKRRPRRSRRTWFDSSCRTAGQSAFLTRMSTTPPHRRTS